MPIEIALIALFAAAFAVMAAVAMRARATARRLSDTAGGTGELAASLNPDEIVERTLEAATALPGVDAALLEAPGPDGVATRAARGLSDEERERVTVQAHGHSNLRGVDVVYRYRLDDTDKAASFLRAGLAVPLVAQGHQIGTLAAFTRTHSTEFPDDTVVALERLAGRAG